MCFCLPQPFIKELRPSQSTNQEAAHTCDPSRLGHSSSCTMHVWRKTSPACHSTPATRPHTGASSARYAPQMSWPCTHVSVWLPLPVISHFAPRTSNKKSKNNAQAYTTEATRGACLCGDSKVGTCRFRFGVFFALRLDPCGIW